MEELDFPLTKIKEGEIEVFIPDPSKFREAYSLTPSLLPVFFNPIMDLNRDFAVLAVQAFQDEKARPITVCEPLAGCGVRGLRFAREVNGVEKVVVNDLNSKAYRLTLENIKLNRMEDIVEAYNEDANLLLSRYAKRGCRFDVIDIDPFGSPVPYLNSALRAIKNGGLLCVTATDTAVLCGAHFKACIRHYGAKPLKTEYCHELAVRILLGFLVSLAAKIDLAVQPVFCHSTNHYVRVYVKVFRGAKKADHALNQLGYVFHCFKCLNRRITVGLYPQLQKCEFCGEQMDFAGPLWIGKLWDKETVKKMFNLLEVKKFNRKKLVKKIIEKIFLEVDGPPTYYVLSHFCDFLNILTPPYQATIKKILEKGYYATPTHFNPQGIRTNASVNILKEVLLEKD